MKSIISKSLEECLVKLQQFMAAPDTVCLIEKAAILMANALINGKKIIACGNGGSLCDATHFAEELTGRFRDDRQPLPAIAINDPAYITCVGNDYCFEEIFSRYIGAIGCAGDILLAITTSGESNNILKAIIEARKNNLLVVCLTGKACSELLELSDVVISTPTSDYSDRVQEIHIKIIHILIQVIECVLKKDRVW